VSSASIKELAVKLVVREKPPTLSLAQISHWAHQGLSCDDMARQFGVSVDRVYRQMKKHPQYFELKRVQTEKRKDLLEQATYTYWKRAATLVNRGYPVERAQQAESHYMRDYGSAEAFERSLDKATKKHPHLAVVL